MEFDEKFIKKFWSKVDIKDENECWEWNGTKQKNGYGSIWFKYTMYGAHRVSYILTRGDIPYKMVICHSCDNPSCVNPNHLWIGTYAENIQDMCKKHRGANRFGERNGMAVLTLEKVKEMRNKYASEDITLKELSIIFNASKEAVRKAICGETWAEAEGIITKLDDPRERWGKLTKVKVLEIRKLLKEGISKKDLAKKYNMSLSGINSIAYYKRWKDVIL